MLQNSQLKLRQGFLVHRDSGGRGVLAVMWRTQTEGKLTFTQFFWDCVMESQNSGGVAGDVVDGSRALLPSNVYTRNGTVNLWLLPAQSRAHTVVN